MEWEGIITSCITSGIIIVFAELIRDWRNKRNKDKLANKKSETENRMTDYEAQKQGLDLVQEFYNKVKEVNADQNKQIFDRFDKRFDGIEKSVNEMVEYLNGDFAEWKKNKHQNQMI